MKGQYDENLNFLLTFFDCMNIKVVDTSGTTDFCFMPDKKEVHIPKKEVEDGSVEKLEICFHEAGHSTNLVLKRNINNYAFEELIAECTGFLMLKQTDNNTFITDLRNVAYLSSWIQALIKKKKDIYEVEKIIKKALMYADDAADLIIEKGGFKNE